MPECILQVNFVETYVHWKITMCQHVFTNDNDINILLGNVSHEESDV